MSNWDDWNGLVASENRFDSPNRNERAASITKPTHIVLHITGTNDYQTVHNRFMNSSQKASAHYVIKKDGTITQYVRDKYRAYHAGILSHIKTLYDFNDGRWKKYLRYFNWFTGYPANAKYLKSDLSTASSEPDRALVTTADGSNWNFYDFWEQRNKNLQCPVQYQQNKDPNSYSIGIELLTVGGKTKDKYEDGLYNGLDRLLTDLCQKYGIPRDREHIIGHEDVNPVERWGWDPNSGFEWDRALASSPTQSSWQLPLAVSDGLECTTQTISALYRHTEQEFPGGYFPVGANTTWHGGLHLLGNPSQTVHAMADGTVVCARMPKADPRQTSLLFGSRNFVLIRHGQGTNTWYSLYYHLNSIDPASSEGEEIAWLKCRALEFTNTRNFRTIPDTEQSSEIIREFARGDKAEIISEDGDWLEVHDPKTQRVGFVKFSAERMRKIDSVSVDLQERFSNGDAVHPINRPVRAGDIIGYLGEGVTLEGTKTVRRPILHWEVFSPSLHKGNWTTADDPDHDFTCDNKTIIDLVEKGASQSGGVFRVDGKLCADEIVAFYKKEDNARKLRSYACKFRAEWSVDWKTAAKKLSASGYTPRTDTLSLYNFWSDATKHDSALPVDGHVWHYNPIAFLQHISQSSASTPTQPQQTAAKSTTINDDSLIFYSPAKKQYLVLNNLTENDNIYKEFMTFHSLAVDITRARQEPDSSKRFAKTQEVQKKFLKEVEGLDLSSSDAVDELMTMKKSPRFDKFKGFVYYRPSKIAKEANEKGGWRKQTDEETNEKLKEIYDEQKKKVEFTSKLTWSFINKTKDFAVWAPPAKQLAETKHFDSSAEGRLLRFGAGISADLEIDPFIEHKVSLGAEGNMSFAIAEGKITGSWYLPNRTGINLFHYLQHDKVKLVEKGYQCNLLLKTQLQGVAFLGVSVSAAIALPNVDFSAKTRQENKGSVVSTEASGSAFLGGQAEGSLGIIAQWSRSTGLEFSDLGEVKGSLAGSFGAGAEAKVEITYKSGKFVIDLGAGVVVGVGGKARVAVEVGLEQGVELIAHILVCADYHRIAQISADAFKAYAAFMFAVYVKPGKLVGKAALAAVEEVRNFGAWLSDLQRRRSGPEEAKMTIASKLKDISNLKNSPPEVLGQVLKTIMITKEPDDFEEILTIMRSAQTDHELKWILRCTSDVELPPKNSNLYERKSGEALHRGIQQIRSFGGHGTNMENQQFIRKFNTLLTQKGINA